MERLSPTDQLYGVAAAQQGLFTTAQAVAAGYTDNRHSYQVRVGHWIRERRGIYRFARFPVSDRPDLMLWQLWSHNRRGEPQGVYSHATALTLYDLSDVMPARLDLTVPHGFQRMLSIPSNLRLHYGRLTSDDVETIDGVRVTSPLRTLLDIVSDDTLAQDLQAQAIDQALRRGLALRTHLQASPLSTRARQRLARVMRLIPDDAPPPVRQRPRVPQRARNPPARTLAP